MESIFNRNGTLQSLSNSIGTPVASSGKDTAAGGLLFTVLRSLVSSSIKSLFEGGGNNPGEQPGGGDG